jgi:hypothetical protein
MRLYGELIVIGLAASCVAWVHRAPEDPFGRATYLCRPVGALGAALSGLSHIAFRSSSAPAATRPWDPELRQECVRFVEEIVTREGD